MIAVIVQARLGSTRLPGKVLMDIAGYPLIHHVFARLKPSTLVNKFILATTDLPQDDALAEWAAQQGLDCYRGSETDVLDRYYQAAKIFKVDIVVRVTADDPFKDYRMLDAMLAELETKKKDFISNNNPPSFPEGMDLEIMTFESLQKAAQQARDSFEREHVTQYIYRHPEMFKIANFRNQEGDFSDLRWTLDTEADLTMTRAVYENLFSSKSLFQYEDILLLAERKPEIMTINKNQKRSAMYSAKQGN
ncbi:MAG: glycosyltransferase family protein [Bdellovibrio sp.]